MKKIILLLMLVATICTSCDDDSRYSIYRVNFSFDKNIYPYIQVNSYGQFICVKRKSNNAGQYELTDATGRMQVVNIPEIQLQMTPFHYGLQT